MAHHGSTTTPALSAAIRGKVAEGHSMSDALDVMGPGIRALRKERGLTQEQTAKAVGASRQAISRWEDGSVLPDLRHACELARVLGVGLDELVLHGGGSPAEVGRPGGGGLLGVAAVGEDGRVALSRAAADRLGLGLGDKLVMLSWGRDAVILQELDAFLGD